MNPRRAFLLGIAATAAGVVAKPAPEPVRAPPRFYFDADNRLRPADGRRYRFKASGGIEEIGRLW